MALYRGGLEPARDDRQIVARDLLAEGCEAVRDGPGRAVRADGDPQAHGHSERA
jgi:hypothetical protein